MNTWITADWHLGHDKLVEMGTLDRLLEIGSTPAWIGGRFVAADTTSK